MKKLMLFDLDDSLVDYAGTLTKDMKMLAAPGEPPFLADFRAAEAFPHLKARMDLIKSQPCWWRYLPVLAAGRKLWELSKTIGFHNQILTKGPVSKSRSWKEKMECVQSNFGKDVDIFITSGQQGKGQVFGHVLYDDYPPYMEVWLKNRPRGLGIMLLAEWNKDFNHPRVIKYNGTNESLDYVKEKLMIVYERKSGEILNV